MALKIKENASLQPFNSMAIPVNAKALTTASSLQKLYQALDFARQKQLSILVLGEGSNTVFENDYQGLVVLNRLKGIDLIHQDSSSVTVKVAAGESWHELVAYSIEQGWYGLENLALIPGLVGAAPMQNIGAYGVEVKDTIVHVEYLEISTQEQKSLTNEECCFSYRESVFKNELFGKVIITSVTFCLSRKPVFNLSYPALATYFEGIEPSSEQVFKAVCAIRKSKLPLPSQIPNTGSFFKNPIVSDQQHKMLKLKFPDLVSYKSGSKYKLAAGWMIEAAGWKKKCSNDVCVHQHQALVIINPKKQSGIAVLNFAINIQNDIAEKFGIVLEIEPRIYR